MIRRSGLTAVAAVLAVGAIAGPLVASAQSSVPRDDLPPIVGSWQIAALTQDGFEFYIQYTFTSDGIVWVFVPDGRHGSGHWEETAPGEVTMSFVIQSGTEGETYVERIWERFPMPAPGVDTWSAEFAYYAEDIEGDLIEGGPAGTVVARRFDVRADLDAAVVTPPPAASPEPSAMPPTASALPDTTPSTDLAIATTADDPGLFDRTALYAPAGAEVTLRYDNQSGHPHNIAIFAGETTDAPLMARTEVASGPGVQEVVFTTPAAPGTYVFVCELHPASMTGTLVTS